MDISATTAPRSDQQNFDDYHGGSRIWTIAEVKQGTVEQPVELHLVEAPGRPYKPSKSMRRVLVKAWGPDASVYAGRRIELYGDPSVKWAGQPVGGIRIASLSHINGPVDVPLTEKRGSRTKFTVQPLPDVDPTLQPHLDAIQQAATVDALMQVWQAVDAAGHGSNPQARAAASKRKAELEQAGAN